MTPPPVGDATLAAVVIFLAAAAALLESLARGSQGAAPAAAWDRFHLVAGDRGLAPAEREALAAWARRANVSEPAQVLRDRALFDRFVRDRVAEVGALEAPGAPGRRAALEGLAALRRRLGHTPPPPPLGPLSSHDVLEGVRVSVRPDALATGHVPPGHFVVSSLDEEALVLRPIEGEPLASVFRDAAKVGRGCWVLFGRPGEAIYRFRTRLLERPDVAAPSVVVAHGEFLVKEERRRAPRLPLRVGARVVSVDGDASRAFDAETLDISSGGVALSAREPLARGSRLAVEIALEPGKGPVPVTVKVVGSGVREVEGAPRTFLNGQFVELSSDSRSRVAAIAGAVRKRSASRETALPTGSPAA